MSRSSEYIEAYFQNRLNDAEKKEFEERCVVDESFSREVALYITISEGVRQKLLDQKRSLWAGNDLAPAKKAITPVRKMTFRKWLPYAAAASILVAIMVIFLNGDGNPRQLASKYVMEHFTVLSQTMDASRDSVQQGIAAYNRKDYNSALRIFEGVYQSNPENNTSKKYIGLVYLVTKEYDKAVQHFDQLANTPGVYKNPGLFLKAVTLLERNREGDEALAKQLLERIVTQKAEGSREAEKWLKEW